MKKGIGGEEEGEGVRGNGVKRKGLRRGRSPRRCNRNKADSVRCYLCNLCYSYRCNCCTLISKSLFTESDCCFF